MIQYIRAGHGGHHPFLPIPLRLVSHNIRSCHVESIHCTVGINPLGTIVRIGLNSIVLSFGVVVPIATSSTHPRVILPDVRSLLDCLRAFVLGTIAPVVHPIPRIGRPSLRKHFNRFIATIISRQRTISVTHPRNIRPYIPTTFARNAYHIAYRPDVVHPCVIRPLVCDSGNFSTTGVRIFFFFRTLLHAVGVGVVLNERIITCCVINRAVALRNRPITICPTILLMKGLLFGIIVKVRPYLFRCSYPCVIRPCILLIIRLVTGGVYPILLIRTYPSAV